MWQFIECTNTYYLLFIFSLYIYFMLLNARFLMTNISSCVITYRAKTRDVKLSRPTVVSRLNFNVSFSGSWCSRSRAFWPRGLDDVLTSIGRCVLITMLMMNFCPSVCRSVTTRYGFKARWDRDSGSSPYDSLESLVSNAIIFVPLGEEIPLERAHQRGVPALPQP